MKVSFVGRVDTFSKFGGDTLQMQMTARSLAQYGVDVLFPQNGDTNSLDNVDILHAFNIDRPFDIYPYISRAHKLNIPIVLSSIHHDYKSIDSFERIGRSGWLRIMNFFARDFHSRERIKSTARIALMRDRGTLGSHLLRPLRNLQSEIMSNVSSTILLANGERLSLESDGLGLGNYCVIQNPFLRTFHDSESRDIDVLVVGRIESRKNQLAIAKALSGTKYTTMFLGGKNTHHSDYVRAFEKVVRCSTNLSFPGPVPPEQMQDYYRRAKICVSASWFEVASLVDLEAYMSGCHVIASKRGHTAEYLGDAATYLDPENIESLPLLISQRLAGRPKQCPMSEFHNESWDDVAKRIKLLYGTVRGT